MDVGVSRFWKSPPRRAAQVDICRPTWRPQDGWGGGGVPVVVGTKGRLRPYFRSGHALGVAIRGESRTRHCTWECLDPLPPPQRAPLLKYCRLVLVLLSAHFIIAIGVSFTGQTLHLQVYIRREERGGGNWWLTISISEEAGRYDIISAYRRARKLKLGSKWGRI